MQKHFLLISWVILMINISANGQNEVSKDSLLLYYPFNDNFMDHSGKNKHPNVYGAMLTGTKNTACFFDGIDDYMEITRMDAIDKVKHLTVSCWINPFAIKPYDSWICKMNTDAVCSQWRLSFGPGAENHLQFTTTYKRAWNDYDLDFKVEMKQWHHILYTIDAVKNKVDVFFDGKKVTTFNIGEISISDAPLLIGYQKDDRTYFRGMLDEVRIYNRLLTDSEVQVLYSNFQSSEKAEVREEMVKPYMKIASIKAKQPLNIRYISCEGFLVESGKNKILVDALTGSRRSSWYDTPSADLGLSLEKVQKPFDDVDIVAVTHNHWDHFNEQKVVNFMLTNKSCKLICPNNVNDILSKNKDYDQIKNRIIPVTPGFNKDSIIVANDIRVRVLRLDHSRSCGDIACPIRNHLEIENIGFVFTINGTTVFHSGDSYPDNELEYKTLDIKKDKIDVALINRAFTIDRGIDFIDKYIKPKNVVFMHLGRNMAYYYKPMLEKNSAKIPNAMIFEQPTESVTFK